MPVKSKRKRLMEKVLLKGAFSIVNAKSCHEMDQELMDTIEELACIVNYRYSVSRLYKVPRSKDWYTNVLPNYDEDRFRSCIRVSRAQFTNILNLLQPLPVFQIRSNNGLPLEVQLAVSLFRFGNEGSGASYERVGQLFGISEAGMVKLCVDRVVKALLSLQQSFIAWPGRMERMDICRNMKSVLPGCIGYVDGCHIPLFEAPVNDHEAYYSRKQQYAIQLQAICDNDLVFRNVTVGVFVNSPIGQFPQRFLDEGQWIAADSAYGSSNYIVTPFRENATAGTLHQRRKFKRHFSSQRVKIEQSFGILKKIFGSLRCLRIRVNKHDGHRVACEWIWILSCIILYNIMKLGKEEHFAEDVEIIDTNSEDVNATTDYNSVQRDSVFNWFMNEK